MWRVDEYGPDGKLVRQWPDRFDDQRHAQGWIGRQYSADQVPDGHSMRAVDEDARNPWAGPVAVVAMFLVVALLLIAAACIFGRR